MRNRRGFTLIEILAALTVLGLVIAMLGQGLRLGLNATRMRDRVTGQTAEMEAALLREAAVLLRPFRRRAA